MLKKTITYNDYNGKERTEDFYFNLSKPELATMQLGSEEGLDKKLEAIVKANGNADILSKFQEIILMSYGERSEDGKFFFKKKNGVALSETFEQSAAYEVLYIELMSDEKAAADFVNGVIPADLLKEVQTESGKPTFAPVN